MFYHIKVCVEYVLGVFERLCFEIDYKIDTPLFASKGVKIFVKYLV